jgi:hypothetical protein
MLAIKTSLDLTFSWAKIYNKRMTYKVFLFTSPFQAFAMQSSMPKGDFREYLKKYHRDVILNDKHLSNVYVSYLEALRCFQ